jgi:hypothetical protein
LADILQNIDREAVHQQIRNNQQEGEQVLANLAHHKKLSAGVVFMAGKAWLGPEVLAAQLECKRIREQKEQEQQDKQKVELEKKRQAYEKTWGEVSNLPLSQWAVAQLRALISYKKTKEGKWPQLKIRVQMLQVWEQIKDRRVEDVCVQSTESDVNKSAADRNVASAALLAQIEGDEDDVVIKEVMV